MASNSTLLLNQILRCCSRPGSSGGPNQKSSSAVARSGRVTTGRIDHSPQRRFCRELLAQIELRMSWRVVLQRRENLVSELFVEGARLKARRLQRRGEAASFNGIFFRGPE